MEPQALILNYRLLIKSGRRGIRFLSCMPQVPADSSNSVATQKALVKTRRTKQEQKDGGNKMSREGGCAGW